MSENQGGGAAATLLKCCGVAFLLAVLGVVAMIVVGTQVMKRFVLKDPAAIEENLQSSLPDAAVPTGYVGVIGADIGLKMTLIAPEGTVAGTKTGDLPLAVSVVDTAGLGGGSAQARDQAIKLLDEQLGRFLADSSHDVTVKVGEQDVPAREQVGSQVGVEARQVSLVLGRTIAIVFRGKVDGFDQAAMDAFLASVTPPAAPATAAPVASTSGEAAGEGEEPASGGDAENPWAQLPVGTKLEQRTITRLQPADMRVETRAIYTVVAVDAEGVSVEMVTEAGSQRETTPLRFASDPEPLPAAAGREDEVLEERQETVSVPAGEFPCTYRKTRATQDGEEVGVLESWQDPSFPLPYKTVSTTEGSVSTTELVSIERP